MNPAHSSVIAYIDRVALAALVAGIAVAVGFVIWQWSSLWP